MEKYQQYPIRRGKREGRDGLKRSLCGGTASKGGGRVLLQPPPATKAGCKGGGRVGIRLVLGTKIRDGKI